MPHLPDAISFQSLSYSCAGPEFLNLNARPRAELSTFEEAGLEIEKLDL